MNCKILLYTAIHKRESFSIRSRDGAVCSTKRLLANSRTSSLFTIRSLVSLHSSYYMFRLAIPARCYFSTGTIRLFSMIIKLRIMFSASRTSAPLQCDVCYVFHRIVVSPYFAAVNLKCLLVSTASIHCCVECSSAVKPCTWTGIWTATTRERKKLICSVQGIAKYW